MRRSTKALLSLIGTAVLVLGVVANFSALDVKAADYEKYYDEKGYGDFSIGQVDEVNSSNTTTTSALGPSAEEIQQNVITAQAAADRQALVNEGSKSEHRTVISSDGTAFYSNLNGLYLVDKIKGIAYTPAGADAEKYYCVAYETDAGKNPAAIAAATDAAKSVNAVVGPSVVFEYGKVEGDNVVKSGEAAEGTMKMGLKPSFAGEGAKVAVVAVYPGGEVKILEDTDDDPTTVTVNVPATDSSLVMYTIIKYN